MSAAMRLVHMCSIKNGNYILTDNQPKLHLVKPSSGQVILNAEAFYNDFVAAKDRYFDALETSDKLQMSAENRYKEHGFMDNLNVKHA